MSQRIVDAYIPQFVAGPAPAGPAAGGQNQPGDFSRMARPQALVNGAVFRVHGHQLGAGSLAGFAYDWARGDERFLVSQRESLARFERGEGNGQAREADNRVQHRVAVRGRFRETVDARNDGRAGRYSGADGHCGRRVSDGDDAGPVPVGLGDELVDGAVRAERDDAEVIGVLVDDFEGLRTDRAGRTEYGYVNHVAT